MRDRSPIWIGLTDLMLACLSVIIVAVAPHKPPTHSPEQKAEFVITADWPVEGADADVDLWVVGPNKKPVFYANREAGCATLDRDSRGSLDDHITLADGSVVKVDSNRETTTLRCIERGRFDVGAHLYAYRGASDEQERNGFHLKVHLEVIRLNPSVKTEWAGDVVLDRRGQMDNAVSFVLTRDGALTLVSPPLEPITTSWYLTTETPP